MFDYGDDWLGCGTDGHDPDCLCDVVITNPLPPLAECMTDAVQDMWMARTMCEVRGYSRPWTRDKILDFLEDMRTFYDAYHASNQPMAGAERLCEVEFLVVPFDLKRLEQWKLVRQAIADCMDKFPDDSLVDIMRQLGVTPKFVVDAMTTGKPSRDWDWDSIARLDALLSEQYVNLAQIGREMGVSAEAIEGLFKYWRGRRIHKWGEVTPVHPAMLMFRKLCLETDMAPVEIVRMVEQKHGVTYARSNVTNTRRRHRNKQVTMEDKVEA